VSLEVEYRGKFVKGGGSLRALGLLPQAQAQADPELLAACTYLVGYRRGALSSKICPMTSNEKHPPIVSVSNDEA